ncbi:DUF3558 domain-containing protein [Saccharomonospora saliphila]|uniref:DUF3558 domain-containing protein n=1 Tax=Saccharomonospora saliphila TaxID=369829 RepID=UPI001E3E845C|nr:DUF3558 domain-containing protein [Saccharomonospora saliphila]
MLVFTVAACTDTTSGSADPRVSVPGDPSASSARNGGEERSAVASIEPCALLSVDDLTDYESMKNGRPYQGSGSRSCAWKKEITPDSLDSLGISLDVRDTQTVRSLKDMGNGVRTGTVNGRASAIARNPDTGDCTLAMKLGESSRFDVGITGPTDPKESCRVAQEVAYIVEPRLPDVPS